MTDVHLPLDSQRLLIEIARQALDHIVRGRPYHSAGPNDPYLEGAGYGAFVTLFNHDELRGCIGTCTPLDSLRATVVEMIEAAATRDRRMKPVNVDELEHIHIDISVLSRLERTKNPLSLFVGKHGIYLARKHKRAVFLPQVATEQGWDIRTLLEQTCLKADLPKGAWRWPGTTVSTFTALTIAEGK